MLLPHMAPTPRRFRAIADAADAFAPSITVAATTYVSRAPPLLYSMIGAIDGAATFD